MINKTIRKYFLDKDEVVAIYLFGSVAEGKVRPGSDIDIAVLFDNDISTEERFDRRLTFIIHLENLLKSEVDVIDLLASSLAFQHRVLRKGKLLFERDKKKRVCYETRLRREYFDFKPYLERYEKAALKRL